MVMQCNEYLITRQWVSSKTQAVVIYRNRCPIFGKHFSSFNKAIEWLKANEPEYLTFVANNT